MNIFIIILIIGVVILIINVKLSRLINDRELKYLESQKAKILTSIGPLCCLLGAIYCYKFEGSDWSVNLVSCGLLLPAFIECVSKTLFIASRQSKNNSDKAS